ncbi:MAG: tetratricopeptide repeat protein [Candidatus Methylomirabilales bacterium]
MRPARRWLRVVGLAFGLGGAGVGVGLLVTWPDNSLGDLLHMRRSRAAMVAALRHRVDREADPALRHYYQGWLAEATGDWDAALAQYRAAADAAAPGSLQHLHAALRLGLVYGERGDHEKELVVYRSLAERHPGASQLSQVTFFLRRGEPARARALLDEAMLQDAEDGRLGSDRALAQALRRSLGDGPRGRPERR